MQLESLGYGRGYSGLLITPDRSAKTWPEHRAGKGRGRGGVSLVQADDSAPAVHTLWSGPGLCRPLETKDPTPVAEGTI